MIGYILLGGAGVCVAFVLKTLFSSEKAEMVPVEYRDLAGLWLGTLGGKEATPQGEGVCASDQEKEVEAGSVSRSIEGAARLFREECVAPHEKYLAEQKVLEVVETLIEILVRDGTGPSVVFNPGDEEAVELGEIGRKLVDVSLAEHSFTVTRILLEMVKEAFLDYEERVPMVLCVGLAHDLGKMDGAPHSVRSGDRLRKLLPDEVSWASYAVKAVALHHEKTNDILIQLLQKADIQARNYELAKRIEGMRVMPFRQWFDPQKFLNGYIVPRINVVQENELVAFTYEDLVYVKGKNLVSLAKNMAMDMSILDVSFFCSSQTETILREIVSTLREAGFVSDLLKPHAFTVRCELKGIGYQRIEHLVPLKIELERKEEIEARKSASFSGMVVKIL